MTAHLHTNWFHELPEAVLSPPPADPGRIEWMRQAPRVRAVEPDAVPPRLVVARTRRRVGAAHFALGVVVGCYLVAGAEWIAGVL